MINIKFKSGESQSKKIQDIPNGTTFMGRISSTPEVMLKFFNGVVSLSDPSKNWDKFTIDANITVYDYKPVDLDIIVK